MSERLIIRLGSSIDKPCHWMVWSEQELEIVDSGVLANATELSLITEKAGHSPVDVFVSSSAITLTQVALPVKGQKQALKAVAYMLEESVVDNVDNLHFVIGPREGEMIDVAIISHEQMRAWLSWLYDAKLKPRQIIPDCLAIPMVGQKWSAMHFDDEYLLRTSEGLGLCIPTSWLDAILPRLLENEPQEVTVATFSTMDLPGTEIHPQPKELPLLVLFRGLVLAPIDLLTGSYKVKREINKHLLVWKRGAIAVGICILLSLVNKGINIYSMDSQIAQIQKESTAIYRQVIPGGSRIVNLRSQLGSELKKLQKQGGGSQLFDMLVNLQTAFKEVPELKPSTLRFDSNRSEIRMQVSAESYAQIEKFSDIAKQKFRLQTGSMNSSDDLVTSTLIIRNL